MAEAEEFARQRGSSHTSSISSEVSLTVTSWSMANNPEGINMLDIPWFHPNLSRHQAEAELLLAEEGVYLLRPRTNKKGGSMCYSVDVKSQSAVKHFVVNVKRRRIEFGQEIFSNTEDFLLHFKNCPLIGDDTGKLIVFKHPYPRDVDEIHDYQTVTTHYVPGSSADRSTESSTKTYAVASKEGYLTKLGAVVKSWKRRWFVLKNEELAYYGKENDSSPIKVLNLREISEVGSCEIADKPHVFRVVLPWRTFYFQAHSREVRDDWIKLLKWKLDELSQAAKVEQRKRICINVDETSKLRSVSM